jgi:CarD family transcriptional regulator
LFDVGDNVVYPHHGAGTVVSKDSRIVLGQEREYLTIKILHNDMTVNVPTENAEKVGLRWVIGLDAVEVVVKALSGESTEMPKNWNRRFKHNRDKMKTGDILELAEVVRNLALRDHEKGLSTGEKQMYVKAKKILASELMYAKTMSEDEALEWLEETLTEGAKPKLTPAEKKAAAAESKKTAAAAKTMAAKPAAKPAAAAKKAPAKATTTVTARKTATATKPAAKKTATARR